MVLIEGFLFYSIKGDNWAIIEAKYSEKNKMKHKHNLHIISIQLHTLIIYIYIYINKLFLGNF
jgi:hypothetical protein